jgi:phosphoribosylformylglycinamidine synthase
MIYFFQLSEFEYFAVGSKKTLDTEELNKLTWLFSGAQHLEINRIPDSFVGPRKEMVTPWSTNAVEITQNCNIDGIYRIEQFYKDQITFDPMLEQTYTGLDQELFILTQTPEPIKFIKDIILFNEAEGLALSPEEITFLNGVSDEIGRPLSDSELFGFSQINSEHCRHKIFNGTFIIDGQEQEKSLFQWIKQTAKDHPNFIVSAYKDNVAFIQGPRIEQFAPKTQDKPDYFETKDFDSVISLKAETHNFPTTVEPFNGAATGAGGEIRDRLAGGQGSFPLAGTAVYMTSYPRLEKGRAWEEAIEARPWRYQTPEDILIKASNGASDFGNKYGQPLICGSLLTFEHQEDDTVYGFDKVIMLAGGIGFAKLKEAQKKQVTADQKIIILGGDNYRIGMGGGAVSSVETGAFTNTIELNAVQRSNPEMQKRVANAVRAMAELDENPIISIHDHGAGGHLNCLSELVEDTGGIIHIQQLPIGDPTLSDKEILSNESQERMGLVIAPEHTDYLRNVSARERAPYYEVGETTSDHRLLFKGKESTKPFDLKLEHLFGASPITLLNDTTQIRSFKNATYHTDQLKSMIAAVLTLEAVASKDWLTNKVDRSVTGKVAVQQTVGQIQLPLNNVAVMALDFKSHKGAAIAIGHAPAAALIDPGAGSRLSVAEALTNMVFAPLTHGLMGISLSANWMWPSKNDGEDSRLYKAVKEISEFASGLGINIPTGKDSLSMTQKYPGGKKILAPGTVIISAGAEVSDVRRVILPAVIAEPKSHFIYIDFAGGDFHLGGSSWAQTKSTLGSQAPDVSVAILKNAFTAVQLLIAENLILSGHDVSSGGLITTLLEMNFPNTTGGMNIDLSKLIEPDWIKILFSEKPSVVLQVTSAAIEKLEGMNLSYFLLGHPTEDRYLRISKNKETVELAIDEYRKIWSHTSYLLDRKQTRPTLAEQRFNEYHLQPLTYHFPENFSGTLRSFEIDLNRKSTSGFKAAIIREKGVNGDREMAYSLWMAGFDVKDVHMTDLISGRENLKDINMIVFVGGFSNSDVLGSAKGWAGSFLFNAKAKQALDDFYDRPDTLSLGVCNGCQLMMELEKIYPGRDKHPKLRHNSSGKFESSFINVSIQENNSVMFGSLSGTRLGIWVAHGEGRFEMPESEDHYLIPLKYSYDAFPANPNGSTYGTAALASEDGRHLALMPHLERSIFPWNWPHYGDKMAHEVTPWVEAFVNAKNWVAEKTKKD